MKFEARVNVNNLDKALAKQLEDIFGTVDKALQKTADFVRDDAKTTAQFVDKTGNLRKSIRRRKSKFEGGGYIVVATGKNVDGAQGYHAHLIEYGHYIVTPSGRRTGRKTRPRPFMRQAAEKGKDFLMLELK